jgi:hypothetical protein
MDLTEYLIKNCMQLVTKDFYWFSMPGFSDSYREECLRWNLEARGFIDG